MKILTKAILSIGMAATVGAAAAQNYAWPEQYEGVMLQGFYWDSYTDTKWANLEAQADELSQFFKLIWIPNSAKSTGGMGYLPVYWFTNHNSAFGSESALLSMIETYKAKGTGIIADVVVNHRVGSSNWYNFPTETWDGKSWSIGLDGICSTDEMAKASGQPKPTGAKDTGDDFDGGRDLDHTNANVQENIKNYCRCLLEKYGYAGFRYDMVKGYSGEYTKIYNEYAKPTFSVGEYWDNNYSNVVKWIDATGKQSAAFDFPLQNSIKTAFKNNSMTSLSTSVSGVYQPAGLLRGDYRRYAVTFVDNHDTYRDGNRFMGNVPAANAFILCSPGTPCVFLPHWKEYKAEIKRLINTRNTVGVNNMSEVKVLKREKTCYMAEVTGTKGVLVVRIGMSDATPEGYTDADIVAQGDMYAVWTKVKVDHSGIEAENPAPKIPSKLYIIGNLSSGSWATAKSEEMTREGNVFIARNVTLSSAKSYFSFVTARGSDWDAVNKHDRYGAMYNNTPVTFGEAHPMTRTPGDAFAWVYEAGTYDVIADFDHMTMTVTTASSGIDDVTVDDNADAVYYNLQGVRIDDPTPGVYIVVRGDKATKEIIR
ncbi:MAG: alpha-amylase family glycosyl hydrolase [Bacteroidales bacterium]|nr:alpha-amylase family glycosyl hydrolase [Bacteroidales bacterium]